MPGPGVNFMKPNGFVAAASITSHTSTPSLSHMIAISFASPMFTERKVFSSNFDNSAVSALDTSTTLSMHTRYSAAATSVQAGVTPPTTLGVLPVWNRGLPGSTRSGLNARNTSLPTVRPDCSSIGLSSSRVVPGYVVLSSTINWPAWTWRPIVSAAAMM